MDNMHFNACVPDFVRRLTALISCVYLKLISATFFLHTSSGGITSHVSLARSLNSFVPPIHEVDVSSAPELGRLCALPVYIPADYRLSFFKLQSCNGFNKLRLSLTPLDLSAYH